ncbi:hypothetical protein B0H66DRAFT_605220 [Apodospora peruviana]|uniref:MYND-type zinc finger protein samB n=1 Tax=Apodospora peruviana TaxID=516989 RepID=A0AAE0I1V5_9PEZI|nr:hypothetical protein B0H66DRAFT_605220 [Apodospora peruviana]
MVSTATSLPQECGNPDCQSDSSTFLQPCSRCLYVSYCSRACESAARAAHKPNCFRANYIKFHLGKGYITNPEVELHKAPQTAFGWLSDHSFDFAVKEPDYVRPTNSKKNTMRQMMAIILNGAPDGGKNPSDPREWMLRLVDPTPITLFSADDRKQEGLRKHPYTVEKKNNRVKLWQVLEAADYQGKEMVYHYDFNNNWEHTMTIVHRRAAELTSPGLGFLPSPSSIFVYLSGSGAPGRGRLGWLQQLGGLQGGFRATKPTKEQREKREWFEENYGDIGDPLDLAALVDGWDRDLVNARIEYDWDTHNEVMEYDSPSKNLSTIIMFRAILLAIFINVSAVSSHHERLVLPSYPSIANSELQSVATETRIRVYVQFKDLKPVVDFVFETEGQLQQYQRVITALGVKRVVNVDPRSRSIRVEVPPRAREVEPSRSLNGFILHFERESEASAWNGPICRPVPNSPKAVVISNTGTTATSARCRGRLTRVMPAELPISLPTAASER